VSCLRGFKKNHGEGEGYHIRFIAVWQDPFRDVDGTKFEKCSPRYATELGACTVRIQLKGTRWDPKSCIAPHSRFTVRRTRFLMLRLNPANRAIGRYQSGAGTKTCLIARVSDVEKSGLALLEIAGI
jgi:hypothetical protein